MKKLIPLISLAAALMVAVFLPISAFADDQVEINTGNFPDKAFRQLVSEKFDKNQDDVLDEKEIGEATSLYMKSEKKAAKIRDLTGIGYLTELTYVDISGCKVKELKLGRNVKIESLYCRNMKKLKELDLSKLTQLRALSVEGTKLGKLDVSKNTRLASLYCMRCGLKELDLSANEKLTELNCSQNKLKKLDVSKNTKLQILYCDQNKLSEAPDVSACKDMIVFHATGNGFRTISSAKGKKSEFDFTGEPIEFGEDNVEVSIDAPSEADPKLRSVEEASADDFELSFVQDDYVDNTKATGSAKVIIRSTSDDLSGIAVAEFKIRPPKVKDLKVTASKGKAEVTWAASEDAGVTGYEIWYKVSGSKAVQKTIFANEDPSLTLKFGNKHAGKKAVIKIRGLVSGYAGAVYGPWSAKEKIEIQ